MKVMYLLVFLPPLLGGQSLEEIRMASRELVAPYESLCACESGADPAVIQGTFDSFIFSTDPCFKCYFPCVYKKLGYLYPNTTINTEAMLASLVGLTKEMVEKCIVPYGTCLDKCHGLWTFTHCLGDEANLTTVKLNAPPCSVSK